MNWDDEDTYGSDILGTGTCFGNLTGKVKTREIGFLAKHKKTNVRADRGRS